jgi:hypothetical protein
MAAKFAYINSITLNTGLNWPTLLQSNEHMVSIEMQVLQRCKFMTMQSCLQPTDTCTKVQFWKTLVKWWITCFTGLAQNVWKFP